MLSLLLPQGGGHEQGLFLLVCHFFFLLSLSPDMCGTREQTSSSLWASSGTLKLWTPRCSPRHPSCWDWERLNNKYSALWQVCTLTQCPKMLHCLNKRSILKKKCFWETLCRAARGRSWLSHTGAVHAAHQAPPQGENLKQLCRFGNDCR